MDADQLLALQRQVLAALRAPLLGPSRLRTDLPPRAGDLPDSFAATAEAHLLPSAALTSQQRLELYHRQYWYRLLDALTDDFPALRLLLGPRAFAALLEAYLEQVPPGADNLRYLGVKLPGFLASYPAALPHRVCAHELARLEVAWLLAFEAADVAPPTAEQLSTRPLTLQPHVTLLALRSHADRVWHRANDEQPRGRVRPPAARPVRFVAVYRLELARQIERLHPAAYALLSSLHEQGSLEVALEAAAPLLPARRASALIESWFRQWTAERWLALREPA